MSIYNPPSKTQGIFNPSNFGGLGSNGEITIDSLKSSFLEFPVAQGNTTLVGASVFGTISQQQGDFTTTGDITGASIEGTSFLVGTTNLLTEIGTKQDTIEDGDLTIANTSGLQTALDNKYDDTGGSIGGSVNITGDLVIGTTNIIDEIGTKQDEIDIDTNITLNSIKTNHLTINGKVDFDTTNIEFNTLVLRRPTGSDRIVLNEIQVWVNDVNIMIDPSNSLIGYFANWDTDKDTERPAYSYFGKIRSVDNVYNNILEDNDDFGTHSGGGNAMIIKDIPLTNINDIQSIVYYNRYNEPRSIGLVLELYNIDNDAGLIYPLASSNVITTYRLIYRYDFPSITSYSGFATGNSTSQIVNDSIALTETINVSNIEMVGNVDISGILSVDTITTTGNVDISGDLVVGTTNIITEIGTKQATIEDGDLTIAKTDGLATALSGKQPTIEDGDLTIAKTDGLATALNEKQATITSATDLTSNSLTTGNITSPKFRVVKAVDNLSDIFPTSETDNTQEIGTITTFGGTLKFDFDCQGSSSSNNSLLTYTFYLIDATTAVVASTIVPFYFSDQDYHFHFGSTDVYTGIPAGTYILLVGRSATNLLHGTDDNFNVCFTEFPF